MVSRPVVLASNRGPISFAIGADGQLDATRGAGGLVSGLGPLVANTETMWVAAALSEGDREAASAGVIEAEGFRVRTLAIDDDDLQQAYDVVCNEHLWFLYHGLFDLTRSPAFDETFFAAWDAYRRYNERFAHTLIDEAPADAAVLVQDYHLSLVGPLVAAQRPDVRCVHFSHTPLAPPHLFRVLPSRVGEELVAGLAGHHRAGFHTPEWAAEFRATAQELIGVDPATFVSPLGSDIDSLRAVTTSAEGEAEAERLTALAAGRQIIGRVDRVELSKNVLRGFTAFANLLRRRPDLHGTVVFAAVLYPSRGGVAAYSRYGDEVTATADAINREFGTADWRPVELDLSDNFARSLAVLRKADVLLVNPIRDGLNLVAKEAALLNERDGTVVLSREAGAHDEFADHVLSINPFDLVETSAALETALAMTPAARTTMAAGLREAAASRGPSDWLADQLRAADED